MSDPSSFSQLLSVLGQTNALAAPSVDKVRSVIRSGDQFLIGGQTEHPPCDAKEGVVVSPFLGAVVVEWGFDVEHHLAAQFARWLADNEPELRLTTPTGCHYWGTYAVFAQNDMSQGAYRTVWAYTNLQSMTALNDAVGATGSRFAILIAELNSFRDRRIGAGRSQQIYQPAAHSTRI